MYVAERLRDVLVLIILGSCYFQGWNLQGGLKQGNMCLFRYLWGLLRKLIMKMYTVSAICVSRYCECYRIPAVCLFNTVLDYFFYCHAKFQDWILSPHSYGMYLQLYTHSLT